MHKPPSPDPVRLQLPAGDQLAEHRRGEPQVLGSLGDRHPRRPLLKPVERARHLFSDVEIQLGASLR